MALGWVGLGFDGGFSAHVTYGSEPFADLTGPREVPVGVAVGWARAHSDEVVVQVDGELFSAGDAWAADADAPWVGDVAPWTEAHAGPRSTFAIRAHTGWYRPDRVEVARAYAARLAERDDVSGALVETDSLGFALTFTVRATSTIAAHAIATPALRDAWAALEVVARPGDDYDCSSIEIDAA